MKLRKYTIDFKLKIISSIPKNWNIYIIKLYGIDIKSLKDWIKEKINSTK